MARNNNNLMLAAAGLGALALLGTGYLLTRPAEQAPPPPDAAPVATATPQPTTQYVATRDIPPRTLITRAMLREVNSSTPIPGAITNPQAVVGQISRTPISAGQTITDGMVNMSVQRVIPANFAIPAGTRGVAVYVDPNSTAAGLVDVGDRVDVVATHKLALEKQSTEQYETVINGSKDVIIGRTIAQDLMVLAVDRSLSAPPPTPSPASGATPAPAGAATPAPTATPNVPITKTRVLLAAAPAVAQRLVAAGEGGTLSLLIRDPNSREQFPVPGSREFPSQIVRVPKRSTNQVTRATTGAMDRIATAVERGAAAPMSQPMPMPAPNFNNPQPMPLPPAGASGGGDTPSGTSEVTVIRGTEKNRVTVPSR